MVAIDTQGKGVWLLWIHRGRGYGCYGYTGEGDMIAMDTQGKGVWLLWLTAAELMKSMWPLESSSFSNACGNIRSFSVGGITRILVLQKCLLMIRSAFVAIHTY